MSARREFNQILEDAGIDADRLQSALAAAGHHVHLSTVSRYIAPDHPESAKDPPAWMVGIARQLAASIGRGQVPVTVSRDDASGQSRSLTTLVPAELFNQFEQARVAEGVKSRSTFALKLLEAGYRALYGQQEGSGLPHSHMGAISRSATSAETVGLSEQRVTEQHRYQCAVCGKRMLSSKANGDRFLPDRHNKPGGKPCPGNYRYARLVEEPEAGL